MAVRDVNLSVFALVVLVERAGGSVEEPLHALALSSSHSPSPCAEELPQIHTHVGLHFGIQVHRPRCQYEVRGLQIGHVYFGNTPRLRFGNLRRPPGNMADAICNTSSLLATGAVAALSFRRNRFFSTTALA